MRIARNTLMILSLLLCLAAGGMWVRSYWVYEWWGRYFAKTDAVVYLLGNGQTHRQEKRLVTQHRGVESIRGSIGIGFERWDMVNTSPAIFAVKWDPVPDEDSLKYLRIDGRARPSGQPFVDDARLYARSTVRDLEGWLGFGVVERSTNVITTKAVVIPYWFLMVCAGAWPGVWVIRSGRRWRWKRMGRCVWCGYDLRGSAGRCPECGSGAEMTNAYEE
jgi:hypothetical protein